MNRELDIQIAKAKGLDVVGEMYACKLNTGLWALFFSDDRFDLHPVYVDQCVCALQDEYDVKYKGHILGCLDVVPFWSSDLNTAFELATEMREHSYGVDIKMRQMFYCIVTVELGRYNIEEMADTPQEAICKAYLEWHLTRNQK